MKKVIISFCFLALVPFLVTSCSKQDSFTAENISEIEDFSMPQSFGGMRVWYDNGGNDFGCSGSGGTCFDDVVILGLVANDLQTITEETDKNVAETIVAKNFNYIKSSLPANIAKGVESRKLNVSFRGTDAKQGVYMIMSYKGKQVGVLPISSFKKTNTGGKTDNTK